MAQISCIGILPTLTGFWPCDLLLEGNSLDPLDLDTLGPYHPWTHLIILKIKFGGKEKKTVRIFLLSLNCLYHIKIISIQKKCFKIDPLRKTSTGMQVSLCFSIIVLIQTKYWAMLGSTKNTVLPIASISGWTKEK